MIFLRALTNPIQQKPDKDRITKPVKAVGDAQRGVSVTPVGY